MRCINLIGKKISRLTILGEHATRDKSGRSKLILDCMCDCGNKCIASKEKVLRGDKKSCGCMQNEMRHGFGDRVKKEYGESSFNEVYSTYRKSASARNYEFSLSESEFREIITGICIYCGDSNDNKHGRYENNGSFEYTGIDRYNNTIGYTLKNSVPCCKICNRIKTNLTIDHLHTHLNKMLDNSDMWKRTA